MIVVPVMMATIMPGGLARNMPRHRVVVPAVGGAVIAKQPVVSGVRGAVMRVARGGPAVLLPGGYTGDNGLLRRPLRLRPFDPAT